MIIERDYYLNKLIKSMNNEQIKIITGIRRCGKSFLLNILFKKYLISIGIKEGQILQIALDDRKNKKFRNADFCYEHVANLAQKHKSIKYYLLLDEVQMMNEFSDVLNGFLHIENLDVYVSGSNSKFLSKDIATEFRGRGKQIKVYPLSFKEFYSAKNTTFSDALNEYFQYGGMPYMINLKDDEDKVEYLKNLFSETYIKDIVERNKIKNDLELETLIDIISSSIGSLTNPQRIANTFKSINKSTISAPTIKKYLDYLKDAFLISETKRYNIKGRKYIGTPSKYYFEDIGLRNARLNFRQQEETHIMENIIFNELKVRGYSVDVGIVEIREKTNNSKYQQKQIEVDFIAYKGSKKYYIQSAYHLPTDEKKIQEERPLLNIADSFKKIIITNDNIILKRDDKGLVTMSMKDFLLNDNSLDL